MIRHTAFFVDGESAGRHLAEIFVDDDNLIIAFDAGREQVPWPRDQIRALRDRGTTDRLILRLPEGDARLVVEDTAAMAWVQTVSPQLNHFDLDRLGLRKVAVWGVGALTALGLMVFVVIPSLAGALAPLVPPKQEVAIGEVARDQLAGLLTRKSEDERFCVNRAGLGALDAMAQPFLDNVDMPYPVTINVIDGAMVNAFAAPGGQVAILRGLIDAAESPEEVAAVLAHELGHVVARDPVRLSLRAAGTAGLFSLVIGDITGGAVVAGMATQLLDASYSRAAERAADDFAAEALIRVGVSPQALAAFFERLEDADGSSDLMGYFSTHPATLERIETALAKAENAPDRPILSPQQWADLRGICRQTGSAR